MVELGLAGSRSRAFNIMYAGGGLRGVSNTERVDRKKV